MGELRLLRNNPAAAFFPLVFHGRIECVEILFIQLITHHSQRLGKPLIVHDFPLTQIAQYILHIRVVCQMQQVLIGGAGLLLCCKFIDATNIKTANEWSPARPVCRKSACPPLCDQS